MRWDWLYRVFIVALGMGACCPGVHSPVVAVGRRRFGTLNPIVQFVEKLLDVRDSQLRVARQLVLQELSLLSGDLSAAT